MAITQLQFVTLTVSDTERARRFYTDLLGFETRIDRSTPDGDRFLLVAPAGAESGVVLYSGNALPASTSHLQFRTTDIDTVVTCLRDADVKVDDPVKMPWGRTTMFHDPDDNAISLLQ